MLGLNKNPMLRSAMGVFRIKVTKTLVEKEKRKSVVTRFDGAPAGIHRVPSGKHTKSY